MMQRALQQAEKIASDEHITAPKFTVYADSGAIGFYTKALKMDHVLNSPDEHIFEAGVKELKATVDARIAHFNDVRAKSETNKHSNPAQFSVSEAAAGQSKGKGHACNDLKSKGLRGEKGDFSPD